MATTLLEFGDDCDKLTNWTWELSKSDQETKFNIMCAAVAYAGNMIAFAVDPNNRIDFWCAFVPLFNLLLKSRMYPPLEVTGWPERAEAIQLFKSHRWTGARSIELIGYFIEDMKVVIQLATEQTFDVRRLKFKGRQISPFRQLANVTISPPNAAASKFQENIVRILRSHLVRHMIGKFTVDEIRAETASLGVNAELEFKRSRITTKTTKKNSRRTPGTDDPRTSIMQALREMSAFDPESRKRARAIVQRAIGPTAKAASYKRVFSELVAQNKLNSLDGRTGGYWLKNCKTNSADTV